MSHFIYHDLGRIEYEKALERQTVAFNALLEAKAQGRTGENRLFFCEHQPVLTIGKSGKDTNLLIPKELLVQRGISFYHINRGGDITYHGPGQITGYPVFDLDTWKLGLKQYIDRLEETIIRFLAIYGIKGERLAGATGCLLYTSSGMDGNLRLCWLPSCFCCRQSVRRGRSCLSGCLVAEITRSCTFLCFTGLSEE